MSKAIIGISNWASTQQSLRAVACQIDAGAYSRDADYHLNFASPTQLFSELSPKRLELLYRLKQQGPLSVYRLAKETGRNYSNVHSDIVKLMELELIEKNEKGRVFVPWDDVEIHAVLTEPEKRAA